MKEKNIEEILTKYNLSEEEFKTILKSSKGKPTEANAKIDSGTKKFYYCYFSDPHIGSKEFQETLYNKMCKMINQYKPDFVINAGDTLEGMSNRAGHIYDLNQVGFFAQSKYAVELLSQINKPIYAIDGNHDGWYQKAGNAGIVVGEDLERRVKNYNFLGQMEGDLDVDGIKIKLFHGNDGSAYAMSYKLQKLIESFTGGEKPNIVHSGHYHKSLYLFSRNVHGIESGTLQGQTPFMRGKKLQAHMGFGFVRVWHDGKGEIKRFNHEFVPYYT